MCYLEQRAATDSWHQSNSISSDSGRTWAVASSKSHMRSYQDSVLSSLPRGQSKDLEKGQGCIKHMVLEFAQSPHSRMVVGLIPTLHLSVWNLHVLPASEQVSLWVLQLPPTVMKKKKISVFWFLGFNLGALTPKLPLESHSREWISWKFFPTVSSHKDLLYGHFILMHLQVVLQLRYPIRC